MDKYQVVLNPAAFRELDSIYQYITNELQEPSIAKKQTDRIWEAIESLQTFPYSHQDRLEGRYSGKGLKQLLVGHYIVIYKIEEKERTVTVITIQYIGRNI